MDTFGQRLIASREKHKMSQKELAQRLNITPTRLNYWEKDKREPAIDMIKLIAQVLDVDANYLIGYQPQNKNVPLYSSEAMKLAADYDSLDEWGKQQLRSVADNEMARCTSSQKQSPKLDIAAEVASYKAELERQEEVKAKLSASDGQNDVGMAKMA